MRSGVYLHDAGRGEDASAVREELGYVRARTHDSQVPLILAITRYEEVVEAVRAAVRTGVPSGCVPDAVEKGEGEGLVEDDEGVAVLAEGVEEGDLPGGERVGRCRGGHEEEKSRSRVARREAGADTCLVRIGLHVSPESGESTAGAAMLSRTHPHLATDPRRPWTGCTTTTSPTPGTRYVLALSSGVLS